MKLQDEVAPELLEKHYGFARELYSTVDAVERLVKDLDRARERQKTLEHAIDDFVRPLLPPGKIVRIENGAVIQLIGFEGVLNAEEGYKLSIYAYQLGTPHIVRCKYFIGFKELMEADIITFNPEP
jgi:hypothetical protein